MGNSKKIAIIPSQGLGDGIIFLVLAQNLLKTDYQIHIYHNALFQLKSWLPQFTICQLPEKLDSVFDAHDFVIVAHEPHLENFGEQVFIDYKQKCVLLHPYRKPDIANSFFNVTKHQEPLFNRLKQHQHTALIHINDNVPFVKSLEQFCSEYLAIENTSIDIPLTVNPSLLKARYKNHIIIHPDSSIWRKNWPARKYIRLAKLLTKKGYEVIFAVSPAEYPTWRQRVPKQLSVTKWNLRQLADNLYESFLFIGNDSGPGHLASLLGTPTITIFPRAKRNILWHNWRPGWGKGKIITSDIRIPPIRINNATLSLISVKIVLKRILKFIKATNE